jgi:hypothetical protein
MGRARQRETHQIKYLGLQNVGFRCALPNLRTSIKRLFSPVNSSINTGKNGTRVSPPATQRLSVGQLTLLSGFPWGNGLRQVHLAAMTG